MQNQRERTVPSFPVPIRPPSMSGENDDDSPPSLNQRGFLTNPDIEYLLGKRELAEGSEYNTRRRISDRAIAGILNFVFLDNQADTDRSKVFDNIPEPRDPDQARTRPEDDHPIGRFRGGPKEPSRPEENLVHGIRDALVYFYTGLHDRFGDSGHERFEAILENAIKYAHERKMDSPLVDVDVSITTDQHGLTANEARDLYLEEGQDALSKEEFRALIKTYPDVIVAKLYNRADSDDSQ